MTTIAYDGKTLAALMDEVGEASRKGFVKALPMLPQCADQMPDSVAQMITRVAKEFGLEASNE